MPLFRVHETVTAYSPWGFPLPLSSREYYRGDDKLDAVVAFFKRYDVLDLHLPPKKTPEGGITVQCTKIFGPVYYQHHMYWLRLDVEAGDRLDMLKRRYLPLPRNGELGLGLVHDELRI